MDKNNFLFDAVKSFFYWFLIAVCTLVFYPLLLMAVICVYPFDSARKGIHPIISSWARAILFICPLMNVKVEGEEYLNSKDTYILVSNHQSIADILVALHLKQSFKFIAKKELFIIPILGWAMSQAGYIPLLRGSHQSSRKAIMIARSLVQRGVSVLFFPEGTRSPDGMIRPFKTGAFKLAAETDVPIVPIVIDGTRNLVPKGSRLLNRNVSVKLKVLKPRRSLGRNNLVVERMLAEVHSEMVEGLSQMRSH